MSVSSTGLVRLLVAVVAVGCGIVVVVFGHGAWQVASGDPTLVDHLAVVGLVWVVALAGCALLVARRLGDLDREVEAQEEPRRRLAAKAHRTERVLAAPETWQEALQPVVDIATGRWVAVEALARFPGGEPSEGWFADAQEAGLGLPLEKMAMGKALDTLPQLPSGVSLSINASPSLILDPSFGSLLAGSGVGRDRLVIEITEHAAVARYEDIRAALLPHREQGLQLAVDDTGAGYASFAHVLRLRPDIIKLDRSLLADIDHDAARRAFVTAIVLLGLELDAGVTAEGVETAAELDTLRSLGVDTVQGYLLARPSVEQAVWQAWAQRDWAAHVGSKAVRREAVISRVDAPRPDSTQI